MKNSFAWLFWRRVLHDRGRVTGAIIVLLSLVMSVFGGWQAIPLFVLLGILDLLFYAGLVFASWRTVGRAVTTSQERSQMKAETRVDYAFDCWNLPARRAKT